MSFSWFENVPINLSWVENNSVSCFYAEISPKASSGWKSYYNDNRSQSRVEMVPTHCNWVDSILRTLLELQVLILIVSVKEML